MARTRKDNVGIFTEDEWTSLTRAVQILMSRQLATIPFDMTPGDMMRLFVKPEHHQLARTAVEVLGVKGADTIEYIADNPLHEGYPVRMFLRLSCTKSNEFAAPRGIGTETYNDELRDKLQAWVNDRVRVGVIWGLVRSLLNEVAYMPSREAARFYWPCIPALMRIGGEHLVGRWETLQFPKRIPAVPPLLKQACVDTQATVAMGMILPEPALTDREVTPTIASSYKSAPLPWAPGNMMPSM